MPPALWAAAGGRTGDEMPCYVSLTITDSGYRIDDLTGSFSASAGQLASRQRTAGYSL